MIFFAQVFRIFNDMMSFRANQRGFLLAFFSLTATLLHGFCCLLPLYTSFAMTLGRSILWKSAQPYLLAVQALLSLYFIVRLVKARKNRSRVRMYWISLLISVAGIGLGLRESIRTKEQEQTIRILENLRYQESVALSFRHKPDLAELKMVLAEVKGVKWRKTVWEEGKLIVHYHAQQVSEEKVLQALRESGYQFARVQL